MYRIRLASGEEAVYRTAQELAKAVSSGVVSASAEVFHKSAGRWLPINMHPDYRQVVSGKRVAASAPQSTASSGQTPPSQAAALAPAGPGLTTGRAAVPAPNDQSTDAAPARNPSGGRRRPLRTAGAPTKGLRISPALALGIAVAGLVGGGAALGWPEIVLWLAAHHGPGQSLSEGMPPIAEAFPVDSAPVAAPALPVPAAPATGRLDSIPTLYPAESRPQAISAVAPDSAAPAAQEETRISHLTATRSRLPSYFEAYADARSEMDDGLDYVSFGKVFAPSRFAAPESLRAARRMVAAAGNIVRVYRGREVMLEQAYRPDDPGGRGSLREPFEMAEASRALLSDTDTLFGLLVSQQGRFSFANEALHFQDPRTARVYNRLRGEFVRTLADWRDAGGAANQVTLPRLVRAFGGRLPPSAR